MLLRSREIQAVQKNLNQAVMAESELIQTIINQEAIQLATSAVIALRGPEARPRLDPITARLKKVHRYMVDQP